MTVTFRDIMNSGVVLETRSGKPLRGPLIETPATQFLPKGKDREGDATRLLRAAARLAEGSFRIDAIALGGAHATTLGFQIEGQPFEIDIPPNALGPTYHHELHRLLLEMNRALASVRLPFCFLCVRDEEVPSNHRVLLLPLSWTREIWNRLEPEAGTDPAILAGRDDLLPEPAPEHFRPRKVPWRPSEANEAPSGGVLTEHAGGLWSRRRGRTVTVGLTPTFLETIGPISSVEFARGEGRVAQGDVVGLVVPRGRREFEISSPIAGEIIAVHSALVDDAGPLNGDPLGRGWLYQLNVVNRPGSHR